MKASSGKGLRAIDKQALRVSLRARLEQDLEVVTAAQRASQAGVTHEESRAESDKDMRATETSYLARGQAERVVALREDIAKLDHLEMRRFAEDAAIAVSALVRLEADNGDEVYFVAPAGGGLRLSVAGLEVCVVTPQSPLGRAMLGRHVDEEIERSTPQGLREQLVLEIA